MSEKHKRDWWEFHNQNPYVWELFVKFTMYAIEAGYTNYSAYAIFERIRWHTEVETEGGSFKVNNNHRPYYARYFHHCFPEYDGFFRTRELH